MGGNGSVRNLGRAFLIGFFGEHRNLVVDHSWFGAVCCGEGLDLLLGLMGEWMLTSTLKL